MSVAGAIRAGAAYVEVFLEQGPMTRGLSTLQSRLRGWSAALGRIGAGAYGGELPGPLGAIARFASSPAGLFTGLLTAAKMAATAGDDLQDLSEKAGTSIEAISALAYAARRADVPAEALANSIKKMQVLVVSAARGGKEAQEVLDSIGLSAAELGRLLPEAQFRRIADRIAAIQNPAERAATAVKIFGKNGTEMLPLLLQGADGIAKWEARAKSLGLVMGGETAAAASRFHELLGDLQDVIGSSVKVIGGSLIPYLTSLTNQIVIGTAAVRDWIKDHRELVVVALQVAGAIVIGGVALAAMSAVLRNLATAITLVIVPMRLLGTLAATIVPLIGSTMAAGATIAGAAWNAAATMVTTAFSAAGQIAALVMTTALSTASALASAAWSVAAATASFAWSAGAVLASAAWTGLQAVAGLVTAAWTTAATAVAAVWTALPFVIDAALASAAGMLSLWPLLIVAGAATGIGIAAAEIVLQLRKAFSSAGAIAGQDLGDAVVASVEADDAGSRSGTGFCDSFVERIAQLPSAISQWAGQVIGGLGNIVQGAAGVFGSILDWIKDAFRGLAEDAQKTFAGIGDALAAGDMALAAKVLWAMLKLEWQKGLAFLEGVWDGFKAFWSDAVTGLAIGFVNGLATIRSAWVDLTTFLTKVWNRWATSTFQEGLADWLAPVLAPMLGVDTEGLRKTMHEDFARRRAGQPADEAAADAQAEATKRKIESDRQATVDQLAADKLQADAARGKRVGTAQAEVDAARRELDEALAKARSAREQAAAGGLNLPERVAPGTLPDITALSAVKESVAGTFSGEALSGLGTGAGVQERMENHLARIAESTDRQNAALERMERSMGDGQQLA